ncbi:iron-sulfur cluster co-chaperone protein HscB [Aricia agestis]|uniref:iron-sulfur cluster co-chaperone protein HscB n=1 Tax=Aricia agestis TaxID=91739 RepID=UPI001C20AF8A|nr:iron-sulfur cluster co-chaperone protein HscB [Aricia agestis]
MITSRLFCAKNFYKSTFIQFKYLSCWSCGKDSQNLTHNIFCPNCGVLQKPLDKNYFKVMGVKETFDLNESELAKKYKELQKHLHPDKYANRNKQEQEISAEYSSLVNDAYKTLLDPLSRGIYMLSLLGKEIPEKTEVDNQFLMEIMEKSEEIENAESEADILRLNEENKKILNYLQQRVSKAFFDGDLKSVLQLLGRMKYYTSIDAQIQSSIRNKGIIR